MPGSRSGYRTVPVNTERSYVYKGNELIGQVRRGLDRKWYPELPHEERHTAAIHAVQIAHEAVEEFRRAFAD